jgi:hypothetical protein
MSGTCALAAKKRARRRSPRCRRRPADGGAGDPRDDAGVDDGAVGRSAVGPLAAAEVDGELALLARGGWAAASGMRALEGDRLSPTAPRPRRARLDARAWSTATETIGRSGERSSRSVWGGA